MSKQVFKIGITGSACSGKSLVGKVLERYGVSIIDAGNLANNMFLSQPLLVQQATDLFGDLVLEGGGRFSLKKLMSVTRLTEEQQEFLNETIYGRIREEVKRFLYSPIGSSIRAVQFSHIFETETEHLYDEVWTVIVDPEIQKERLMARDNISEFEAEERIRAGMPQDIKVELSKRVIDNSGDRFKTEQQAMTALNDLKRKFFRSTAF